MHRFRDGVVRRATAAAVLPALLMAGLVGCKTQDDAAAAADQMVKTSATLAAYYDALDTVVANTEDVRRVRFVLDGLDPDMAVLQDDRKQLQMRRDLATQIAKMAAALQQIVTSTASSDSVTAASKFNAELVSLKAFSDNDTADKALSSAVQLLVGFIQAHDEVKAARQVEPVTKALADFFDSEKAAYDEENHRYLTDARAVSRSMVKSGQVDVSPVFRPALAPFHLEPAVNEGTKKKSSVFLDGQIDEEYTASLARSTAATAALSEALHDMDARVTLVAKGQPMKLRLEPVSLMTVKAWVLTELKEAQ